MLEDGLKLILKSIYGFSSRNIPLVVERDDKSLESLAVCHDGKTIVKYYSNARPDNTLLKMFSQHVDAFEQDFGDSTTFLSLLMCELLAIGREISDSQLQHMLDMIDSKTESGKSKEWVKTVMKNDPVSDTVATILSENKIHLAFKNRTGVDKDSFETDKVIGYELVTSVEPIFQTPSFKHAENVKIVIDKRKITPQIYKDYLVTVQKTEKRLFVICDWYDSATETLINSQVGNPVVLIKTPFGKSYILDDLIVVLDAKHDSELNTYVSISTIKIFEDKVLFIPSVEVPYETLEKYAKSITRSAGKNAQLVLSAKNRARKIIEGQINHLYIDATTKERMTDLHEMITDILSSARHLDDKFVKGYMQWYDGSGNSPLSIALDGVKECFELKDKYKNFYEDAYDSANVIKAALIRAVTFNNEILKIDFKKEIRVNAVNQ